MEYFLKRIANLLYSDYGNSLNRHCLVFPSRRAGLYLLKYLAEYIEKPVWVPSILTINELFRSYSSLQLAGNEKLLFEMYKVYMKLKNTPESFDEFYFWGDMLLSDFEDIDKYLVDASMLFQNVFDIKTIDQQFGTLTEKQIEIIRRFWLNFNRDQKTNEKTGFIEIWSILNQIYQQYRISLRAQNLAYEGMIFRDLAENTGKYLVPDDKWDTFHFIGFNALNNCEKNVMLKLKKEGMARFYWDYDTSYLDNNKFNSAGFFLRDNLKIFGNDMPADWSYETMLSKSEPEVHRHVIDTSSDVAQVKLISDLIKELPGLTPDNSHHTAVVLSDENLLMSVLTSLPGNMGDINITMGLPVKQTLVYTLVRHLMDMQSSAIVINGVLNFGYRDVLSILKHTLVSGLLSDSEGEIINEIIKDNLLWIPAARFEASELLSEIFRKPDTPSLLSKYFKDILSVFSMSEPVDAETSAKSGVENNIRNEFIYRTILSINRLEAIVNSNEVTFTTATYIRILDRMLKTQSVPFSGEPLSGIQIMGILETRALDFRNLIILSMNEGVIPAVSSSSSFIPFSLRDAFGLPSVNHQESIYAYHFFRLLQRAENVTFTYNSNSDGLKSGEISRFLIQMRYDNLMRPEFKNLGFEIRSAGTIEDYIDRTEEHVKQLNSKYLDVGKGRVLSPSAINTWLNCRMKFYYRYVNSLAEPDSIVDDIDPAMLGNILHETIKQLYSDSSVKLLTVEWIKLLLDDHSKISRIIKQVINTYFRSSSDSPPGGNELIVTEVLRAYIINILKADISVSPFSVLALEDSLSFKISVNLEGKDLQIPAWGKVDRIDQRNGTIRIVDYKTGEVADSISSISDLFEEDRKKDKDAWLQTLLYCEAYLLNNNDCKIYPSVYKVRKIGTGSLQDKLILKNDRKSIFEVDDYTYIRDEFTAYLKDKIETIFNINEPFKMTSEKRAKCAYCPYKSLCMR